MAPARRSSAAAKEDRARSRSPKRITMKAPKVKDWVLVKVDKHFWKDAVPALVTGVSVGLEAQDAEVSLVLPNNLALMHGFGAKGYKEMQHVKVSHLRPFEGSVEKRQDLVRRLVAAIKQSRVAVKEQDEVLAKLWAAPTLEAPEDGDETAALTEEGECQKEEAEEAPTAAPAPVPEMEVAAPEQPRECESGMASETSVGEGGRDEPCTPAKERSTAAEEAAVCTPAAAGGDATPAMLPFSTPATGRALIRHDSEEKQPLAAAAATEASTKPEVDTPPVAEKVVAAKAPADVAAPLDVKRFRRFTALLARGFGKHGQLTREEAAAAVADEKFTETEAKEALCRLEQQNKIFVHGELILRI